LARSSLVSDRRAERDKDITENPDTWKFGSREIEITEMNKSDILQAALHCVKRIFYYRKQIDYAKRQINKAAEDKDLARFEKKLAFSEGVMTKFSEKLFLLEDRASELGFELPDDYPSLKRALNEQKKEEQNITQS